MLDEEAGDTGDAGSTELGDVNWICSSSLPGDPDGVVEIFERFVLRDADEVFCGTDLTEPGVADMALSGCST